MITVNLSLPIAKALLRTLEEELGDALQLYSFISTDENKAKVDELQRQYDDLRNKLSQSA